MDEYKETVSAKSTGFFKHVFNFDDENKHSMLNMLQYTMLTFIPVVLILRGVKYIFPEEDDTKGSLEILAESVAQIGFIIIAIWFTQKIIYYIPTYSGQAYQKFHETDFIIPFILILVTMQTKLGAKINILIDRLGDLWHGRIRGQPQHQQGQQGQPQGQQQLQQHMPQHQPSSADYLDRTQLLPSNPQLSAMPTQPRTDFNSMYQQNPNPLVGAAMPSMEPMASNEALGGGGSWSSF
jgi:hypothetical protein